jgi:hypothetical protein
MTFSIALILNLSIAAVAWRVVVKRETTSRESARSTKGKGMISAKRIARNIAVDFFMVVTPSDWLGSDEAKAVSHLLTAANCSQKCRHPITRKESEKWIMWFANYFWGLEEDVEKEENGAHLTPD